jgi:hypothetical protein
MCVEKVLKFLRPGSAVRLGILSAESHSPVGSVKGVCSFLLASGLNGFRVKVSLCISFLLNVTSPLCATFLKRRRFFHSRKGYNLG